MSCADLPYDVKALFPKENLDFAHTVTKDESQVLKEVFSAHGCFEQVGEMIEAVSAKNSELGERMRSVLQSNCDRLNGLSPEAIEYSKKIIHFVTHIMCQLTLGHTTCFTMASELHNDFKELSLADQAALKKNNPDISF